MEKDWDFSGWATKNDIRCSDGRTIRRDAFIENDNMIVPLVWNHQHDSPKNVLGHALLKNEKEGVRAFGWFNKTDAGQDAKQLVMHGDIRQMSIYANQLRHNGADVVHGNIREVSLVHAGANPGAYIDSVLSHADPNEEEGVIAFGVNFDFLAHYDDTKDDREDKKKKKKRIEEEEPDDEEEMDDEDELDNDGEEDSDEDDDTKVKHADSEGDTIGDVFNTLTDKQKDAVYAMIGLALEDKNTEGDDEMKQNAFNATNDEQSKQDTLTHSEMEAIFADVKRYGSLKESVLAHGITNIEYLFPDAKSLNTPPDWISREMDWVRDVMNTVHKTPFSRIKSMFADITEDDARAKGYIKGKLKKEELFSLLKRTTTPTTIYKKQKLDRDDVIDITDFDVVAWLKSEMRMMLDEEIARAILVGDGRLSSSDDKINENNIRPIFNDADLYTIKVKLTSKTGETSEDIAKNFIKAAIKSRKDYKGSGNPVLYTTEDMLTDMLLLEDQIGRTLYDDVGTLARKLRVSRIVTTSAMENVKGSKGGNLLGIIANLVDYNVGADRGGAVNMFDDFDIDYNAQKYLIETRCSGALIKPYSAIAIEDGTTGE